MAAEIPNGSTTGTGLGPTAGRGDRVSSTPSLDGDGRTALVTGAAGFMGKRLCDRLLAAGYDVRATDLPDARDGTYEDVEDAEFFEADLTEPSTLDGIATGVDDVFHTASLFSYASNVPWDAFEAVNVHGTRNLCTALLDADVDRLVHWSTVGVYGAPRDDLLPVTEEHPKNPESNYDKSKWHQEQVIHEFHEEEDLPVVVLRPAPVYGPGNTYGVAQLWFAIAKGYLQVFPSFCDYHLPLVHVEDVIRASTHLAKSSEEGEAYNLVDDQQYTLKEVVKYVASLTDSRIYGLPLGNRFYESLNALRRLVPYLESMYRDAGEEPPFERDALFYLKGNYHISNAKLRATGFEPAYPGYQRGLAETVEWYRTEGML